MASLPEGISTSSRQASAKVVTIGAPVDRSGPGPSRKLARRASTTAAGRQAIAGKLRQFRKFAAEDAPEHNYRSDLTVGDTAIAAHLAIQQSKVSRGDGMAKSSTSLGSRGPFGGRAALRQPIPWYIIDPTGRLIQQQRSDMATRRNLDGNDHRWLRLMLHMPTLQPGWDWLTGCAIVFTAIVTPYEVGYLPPSCSGDPLFIINRLMGMPLHRRGSPRGSLRWNPLPTYLDTHSSSNAVIVCSAPTRPLLITRVLARPRARGAQTPSTSSTCCCSL